MIRYLQFGVSPLQKWKTHLLVSSLLAPSTSAAVSPVGIFSHSLPSQGRRYYRYHPLQMSSSLSPSNPDLDMASSSPSSSSTILTPPTVTFSEERDLFMTRYSSLFVSAFGLFIFGRIRLCARWSSLGAME